MQYIRQIATLLIVVLLTSACSILDSSAPQSNNRIVYGLTESVTGIDPHLHTSQELSIILRQIYETLVYRHPETREFVPGLAQSWEISADGLSYTFYLREDVVFHDGTAFTSQSVADNLQRILNPEIGSQYTRQLLGPIVSYQVLDAYSIKINLSRPFEPFLDSLSQVYLSIASPTAFNRYADTPLRYQFHQVGTGAFELVEYVPEDRIVIRRNPNYTWYPSFYNPPPVNAVQEIEFRFFRDAEARLAALEQGNVQIMGGLSPIDARSLSNNLDIVVLPTPIPGQPLQFYYNTDFSPTDNLAVRQALNYAANRTSIAETIYGGFSPVAWGPLSANSLYYNRGVRNVYAYNLQQAQSLLAQAGYIDENGDGTLEKDGEILSITVLHSPDDLLPNVAQFLKAQWETIGIHVELRPVPGQSAVLEAAAEGDYNLIALDTFGLDPYILNQHFISAVPQNWSGFNSPELDNLLLEAERIRDPDERRLSYGRVQAIILEQSLILPVSDRVVLNAFTANIQGLRYDLYGSPILHDVSINR
ncbi:MAG: ABC transporter substrate-binding protein [Anaerolineae bacterium]|nr:ABC transporter substrate-binding protein [Anaerolineae bacterium]